MNERLTLLLDRQFDAYQQRELLNEARKNILVEVEDAGLRDLNEEQDRRYRALTREIAEVDDEIAVRDEEIDKLAALSGMDADR